jgi:hypothetical protein
MIKKLARPRAGLCGVKLEDITDLPYRVLKTEVPDMFDSQKFDDAFFSILKHYKKNITFKRVKKAPNNEKLLFMLWIRAQYARINEMEGQYLTNQPDIKLMQAGIKELDVLGDINTIDSLAGGDILKWESIRDLPYSEVFNKLLKNTIEARINKKLVEINKQK